MLSIGMPPVEDFCVRWDESPQTKAFNLATKFAQIRQYQLQKHAENNHSVEKVEMDKDMEDKNIGECKDIGEIVVPMTTN